MSIGPKSSGVGGMSKSNDTIFGVVVKLIFRLLLFKQVVFSMYSVIGVEILSDTVVDSVLDRVLIVVVAVFVVVVVVAKP